ncbi:hypothetical protein [Corynebacterium renale]|uniref:hypothetical protein n=1 Tax=Corynebacterium renale TaxID=1724 RepID=UPI001E501E83|nr:hypothetical protein [Corynebacterium renale]
MNTSNPVAPPPTSMKIGAGIAIVQSLVVIAYAILLIVRQFLGYEDQSIVNEGENNMAWVGTGTAAFMLIIFGFVTFAAITLIRGKHHWGRGPIAILQMLLLPMSFQMFQGGAVLLAIVTALSAIICLVMLFNRQSVEWAASAYRR